MSDFLGGAHPHVMINHLPIMGGLIALLLLALALWRPSERGWFGSGAVTLVLAALGGLAAYFTGGPAAEAVEALPGVSGAALEVHHERALIAVGFALVAAGAAVGVGVFAWKKQVLPSRGGIGLVLGLSLGAAGAMTWTAEPGGQVMHAEFRPPGAPTKGGHSHGGGKEAPEHDTPAKGVDGEPGHDMKPGEDTKASHDMKPGAGMKEGEGGKPAPDSVESPEALRKRVLESIPAHLRPDASDFHH